MVTALGVDMVEIRRIKSALERFRRRFPEHVLSPEEKKYFEKHHDRAAFLAGRFAAKEAAIKALSVYLDKRPSLAALAVLDDEHGQPRLFLPAAVAISMVGIKSKVSISHSCDTAMALVIFEEDK